MSAGEAGGLALLGLTALVGSALLVWWAPRRARQTGGRSDAGLLLAGCFILALIGLACLAFGLWELVPHLGRWLSGVWQAMLG